MAKYMLYCVYDSKVKYYQNPIFMRNRGEALRSWEQVSNDEKSAISQHPEEFALMEVGEFDDQDGTIKMHSVPESLGLAVHFKRTPQPQATPLFAAANEKVN